MEERELSRLVSFSSTKFNALKLGSNEKKIVDLFQDCSKHWHWEGEKRWHSHWHCGERERERETLLLFFFVFFTIIQWKFEVNEEENEEERNTEKGLTLDYWDFLVSSLSLSELEPRKKKYPQNNELTFKPQNVNHSAIRCQSVKIAWLTNS